MGLFDFFRRKPEVKVEVLQPTPGQAIDIKLPTPAPNKVEASEIVITVPEETSSEAMVELVASDAQTVETVRSNASVTENSDVAVDEANAESHAAHQAAENSMSKATIASASVSESIAQSKLASVADSESASVSESESVSLSEVASESESVSVSESTSLSESESVSVSESTSLSESESVSASESTSLSELEAETDANDLDKGLTKTRRTWSDRWNSFMSNFRTVDEDFFDDLEETLISADVGAQTAVTLTDELRDEVKLQNAKNQQDVSKVIIEKLIDLYERQGINEDTSMHLNEDGLTVILFVGVNGVGKTTTIGKMSERYKREGKQVLLAAADTFRAGATEQLVEWGNRNDIPVVTGKPNVDPASVVYDGVKTAQETGADVLFVDTAGRLQNNVNLMQELAKMKRIIQREIPDAPQEVLLVLDATTGQNALQQARLFKDSTDVTGIVLTKLDGTAKGGIILPIRNELHLPVKWIGIGEKVTDLQPFDADEFVKGLFGRLLEDQ
ncbi:signal recognition particle-docking protein FtsY [Weissella minor]|uniref:Signal recognition particle receptor FtsY n=1 Tax=Weissella minor TaxID=1620 RepID=A0A0R2JG31_9LACO|nr:signal recognition particle-docking protein FtsY [Weissella minor]KRN76303.1 signal recognition particle-docking protein ftsy [Weissella minor]